MIKFYEYGVENVLTEIKACLINGLKSGMSKSEKDKQMTLALGYAEALFSLITIEEEDEIEEEKE